MQEVCAHLLGFSCPPWVHAEKAPVVPLSRSCPTAGLVPGVGPSGFSLLMYMQVGSHDMASAGMQEAEPRALE